MRKTFATVLVLSSFFLAVLIVKAQDDGTVLKPSTRAQTDKVVGGTQRCGNLVTQIDRKINKYNSRPDHRSMSGIQQRLSNLIAALEADGVDVSQLEADLSILQTKAAACESAFEDFLAELEDVKDNACSLTPTPGLSKSTLLADANTALREAKTVCQDARAYLRVIKTHLSGLSSTLKSGTASGILRQGVGSGAQK